MAKGAFKVEGLSDLQDTLRELPRATEKNVLRRALLKAAKPIADAYTAAVTVRSGKLKRSINVGTRLTKRQKSLHEKQSEVEVFAGAGGVPQAHLEEFGSAHNVAHPALRPAWDANKTVALDSFSDDLRAEIDKAVQRAARKAAKQLALMNKK